MMSATELHLAPMEEYVEYCRGAEAFQDIPFSLRYTYQALDNAFPGSRFVLSVREDEDEWYRSLIRFHQKRLGIQGRITREHLVNDPYRLQRIRLGSQQDYLRQPRGRSVR
ncbi:MAG TPA: sulfotransferase [Anaerolineae bacterium]|nr:sulfotransferase [Anaerolineae bacterium]